MIRTPEQPRIEDGSFERPFVRSNMNREQVIEQILAKHPEAEPIMERQELVAVKYLDKDNQFCEGQIFVDRDLAGEVAGLFDFLLSINYQVEKVIPIQHEQFDSEDNRSMQDNNSSGMNFRYIKNTNRLSLHAFGFAIDINPRDNPLQWPDGSVEPEGAIRDLENPDVLTPEHKIVKWLEEHNWEWGGHWTEPYHDNHHFQKPLATEEYKKNLLVNLEAGALSKEDYDERLETAKHNSDLQKDRA